MAERTINECEAIVTQKETDELNDWIDEYYKAKCERPVEAEVLLGEILKENRRLNPTDKFDEEEVIISRIIKRRR
jgi:hypothetical protein